MNNLSKAITTANHEKTKVIFEIITIKLAKKLAPKIVLKSAIFTPGASYQNMLIK